jgi:GAF domain-containing protein
MTSTAIPESLQQWAKSDADVDEKLTQLMVLYSEALNCQRCILYCRQPDLHRANTTHAWWSPEKEEYAVTWESWFSSEWVDEVEPNAPDPLYSAALVSPEAIFIDDIENDPSGLINVPWERETFKHRALIHAPIYYEGKFYGILEPSVFGEPRHWSETDKEITRWTQEQLGPIVSEYVERYGPK